jgi:PST family polysaccharide transporter
MRNLREKVIRGGAAKICSQATNFLVRLGTLMVLARLLDPKDFGLVGMVTAVIGALYIFRDFGLSTATVQRTTVTHEQTSTLFWINISIGIVLVLVCTAIAPLIARFYHEPRLVEVSIAVGTGFLFNAAGVQHSALLQRQMRFTTSDANVGLVVKVRRYRDTLNDYGVGPGRRDGHRALIQLARIMLSVGWMPETPASWTVDDAVRAQHVNGLIVYIAYNIEKV